MPEPGRSKITEGPVHKVLLLLKAELGFFHFVEIVTGWLLLSTSKKIPVQPGWYLPPQKTPLAENGFLQASKGTENTKEKFRHCFTTYVSPKKLQNSLILLVHAHLVVTRWQAIVIIMGVHTWS